MVLFFMNEEKIGAGTYFNNYQNYQWNVYMIKLFKDHMIKQSNGLTNKLYNNWMINWSNEIKGLNEKMLWLNI